MCYCSANLLGKIDVLKNNTEDSPKTCSYISGHKTIQDIIIIILVVVVDDGDEDDDAFDYVVVLH